MSLLPPVYRGENGEWWHGGVSKEHLDEHGSYLGEIWQLLKIGLLEVAVNKHELVFGAGRYWDNGSPIWYLHLGFFSFTLQSRYPLP